MSEVDRLKNKKSFYALIQTLLDDLFGSEERQFQKVCDDFWIQCREASTDLADAYTYWGQTFRISSQMRGGAKRRPVPKSLEPRAEAIMKDRRRVLDDKQIIRQYLFLLCDSVSTFQELRDTLPECLAITIPELNGLPRTNEEGYSLKSDLTRWNNFQRILPRIQTYAVSRMFY